MVIFSECGFVHLIMTISKVLILLFSLFLSQQSFAQCQVWSTHLAGELADRATDMETDALGNLYITGTYQKNLTIGTDVLQDWNLEPSFFIAKFTSEGVHVWTKDIFSNTFDANPQLSISNSRLYWMTEAVDSIVFSGFTFANSFSRGPFVAGMNHDGLPFWMRDIYGVGESALDMEADAAGNTIFTGSFGGFLTVLPGVNLSANSMALGLSCYIIAYSNSGSIAWMKANEGDPTVATGRRLVVDAQDNTYLGGTFHQVVQFDSTEVTGDIAGTNMFLAKFGPTGNTIWMKSGANPGRNADMYDLTTDAQGNVYGALHLAGSMTYDGITIDGQNGQAVLMKIDPSGNLVWYKQAGKPNLSDTLDFVDRYTDISISPSGEVYGIGSFQDGAVIESETVNAQGDRQLTIAVYDASGSFQGLIEYPGAGNTESHASLFDQSGNLVMLGNFDASFFTVGGNTFVNAEANETDIFLARVCDTAGIAISTPEAAYLQAKIFPNPVQNDLQVEFGEAFSGNIQLLDLQGRVLWSHEKGKFSPGETLEIDLNALAKGIYLLNLQGARGNLITKIVKQ